MTKDEFALFCQSHGLHKVADTRYAGKERGFPIALTWAGAKKLSLTLPATKDDEKSFSKALKDALKERTDKSLTAAWGVGFVTVYIDTSKISDPYCQGVTTALDILRSLGFSVPDRCLLCGGTNCDAAIPRGAAYIPVHRNCLDMAVIGTAVKAESNSKNGSYILGAIGAVLGMFVGIIPSALTIIFAQRIFVLFFALLPLCIYWGYKLLKGKMNKVALVLSIVLSVVGVYVLNYIMLLYSLGDYFGLSFGDVMSLLPAAVSDASIFAEISKSEDFLFCMFFAAIGIFLAWRTISHTSSTDLQNVKNLSASAIPYGEVQSDGYAPDPADYSTGDIQ